VGFSHLDQQPQKDKLMQNQDFVSQNNECANIW